MTSNKTTAWAGAGEVRAHGLFIDGREIPARGPTCSTCAIPRPAT